MNEHRVRRVSVGVVVAVAGWVNVSAAEQSVASDGEAKAGEQRRTLAGKRAVFDNQGSEETAGGLELDDIGPWPAPTALTLSAVIVPAKGPGSGLRREIVTRSLEPGQKQFPFGMRLDAQSHLEGWVNNAGTNVTMCRATRSVAASKRVKVTLVYDGNEITLWVDKREVGRCAAPGAIQNLSGHTVIGAQRHGATLSTVFKGRIERVAVIPRAELPVKARSAKAGR